MSLFSIVLIVAVILFVREEVLSSLYRSELKRANEEYEEYKRAIRRERYLQEAFLEEPSKGSVPTLTTGGAQTSKEEQRFYPAA